MTTPKDGGISPSVFLQIASWIVSAAMLIVGGFLATQRDDNAEIVRKVNEQSGKIAVLEARVDDLREHVRGEREDHEREQRGR